MLNKKLVIKVNGIRTLNDASMIRKCLYKNENIKSIKVSLKGKKITLIHSNTINVLEIQKTINALGYKYIGVE